MYDPVIGRWNTPDLMAEFYYNQSQYNYVANNPIYYVDPDGNFLTKFGAWLWRIFNGGGDILQDKGGEYFVSQRIEDSDGDDEVDVILKRTFDWEGGSEGKDLEFEDMKRAFITQSNFRRSMESMGMEVNTTDNLSEARASMLQIPSVGAMPNLLKTTSAITNTTKSSINSVDDLLKAAGKLEKLKGARQGFVGGNAQKIFRSIVKGGTKVRGNLYQLKDGTLVNLHKSTRTGVHTIDINKAGQVFKIRIQ